MNDEQHAEKKGEKKAESAISPVIGVKKAKSFLALIHAIRSPGTDYSYGGVCPITQSNPGFCAYQFLRHCALVRISSIEFDPTSHSSWSLFYAFWHIISTASWTFSGEPVIDRTITINTRK